MTSIRFNILFTIELLHAFFANGKCPDFMIQPSPQTASLLNGYRMMAKQFDNKLYVGIATDDTGHPSLSLPDGLQFIFFLNLLNPQFYNYTNLPSSVPQNAVYYVTNRNSNISNGKTFLSQPIAYNNAVTYHPGDIVTGADGITFRANRTVKNITPSSGDDWMQVDANRYLSGQDIVPVLSSKSTYRFTSPQSSATIQVHGFNPAAPNDYSTSVYNKTIVFDVPVSFFTLNLGFLPPGKYKVKVNSDVEQTVYINDELNAAQTFAVIDLYSEPTLPDSYRMLDSDTLRSPAYTVSFLNRATIWKYALMSNAGTISDNASVYHFSSPSPGIVSSLTPIPLSEKALSLKLAIGAQEYSPIACASPQRLARFSTATEVYDCSEIFLNY